MEHSLLATDTMVACAPKRALAEGRHAHQRCQRMARCLHGQVSCMEPAEHSKLRMPHDPHLPAAAPVSRFFLKVTVLDLGHPMRNQVGIRSRHMNIHMFGTFPQAGPARADLGKHHLMHAHTKA